MRDSSTDTATGTTTASDPAPETLDPVADGDLDELQARVDALSSELNRLRAHYQRVVDTVPSGIFIVDTDGLIVEMNSQGAATLGRTEAEVVHRRVSDFVAPEDRARVIAQFQRRMSGHDAAQQYEFHVIRPTGERRLLRLSAMQVHEVDEIVGVHCVVSDITEERTRDLQRRRSERIAEFGPLLSGIAHELNNPLTSIRSFAELMLLDDRDEEDIESLEIIRREAERASGIIQDLRIVARQTQDTGAGRGMLSLNDVARRVLELRADSMSSLGIDVICKFDENLPSVWAVANHIEQAATNIVINAEQAMRHQDRPRRLTVTTYRSGDQVSLRIEDTGHGIEPNHIDNIFDPFWTTRAPGEGTGLGLSLANSILADHSGSISVGSEAAKGTHITLTMPAIHSPPVLGEVSSAKVTKSALRVLIADDEAPIRQSLGRYLERRGHTVDEAADGKTALSMLLDPSSEFDVLLIDLWMPGLSGLDVLDALDDGADGRSQRVIFITGDSLEPDAHQRLTREGIPVVAKPFELAEIAQIIESRAELSRYELADR